MRLVGIVVFGVLAVTVVAEGAYIVQTRRQVDALHDQVQQLAAESAFDERPPLPPLPGRREGGPLTTTAAAPLPPPRFAAGAAARPAEPLALASPEVHEQLRQMVAAELERARDEQFARMRERRDQDQTRRMEAVVKAMALAPDDSRRLSLALAAAQDARRQLRDKVQSGEIARQDVGQEMAALRQKTDSELTQILGEDGKRKLDDIQRQQGFGPGGGPGGGFGGRGGLRPPPAP